MAMSLERQQLINDLLKNKKDDLIKKAMERIFMERFAAVAGNPSMAASAGLKGNWQEEKRQEILKNMSEQEIQKQAEIEAEIILQSIVKGKVAIVREIIVKDLLQSKRGIYIKSAV